MYKKKRKEFCIEKKLVTIIFKSFYEIYRKVIIS